MVFIARSDWLIKLGIDELRSFSEELHGWVLLRAVTKKKN